MQCSVNGLPALGLLVVLLAGCSSNNHAVILMPDPDGHVGSAAVTTAGGTQILAKAGDMTRILRHSAPPTPPVTVDAQYLAVTFADVLAVAPLPPEKFILFFETGTTTLVPQSQPVIETILDAIKRRGAITIAVSGHTDAVGSNQFNDKLAHDRAVAIQNLLLRNGIEPDRLTVSSHGKGNPLVPTPDCVAEPKNRRVEVIVR
jgi:outer membrane protein OmpA-like peptidoglycan-associated protein